MGHHGTMTILDVHSLLANNGQQLSDGFGFAVFVRPWQGEVKTSWRGKKLREPWRSHPRCFLSPDLLEDLWLLRHLMGERL